MERKHVDDLCHVLWQEFQAAEQAWMKAAEKAAELQTAPLAVDRAPVRLDARATSTYRLAEAARKVMDEKYEIWRMCHDSASADGS